MKKNMFFFALLFILAFSCPKLYAAAGPPVIRPAAPRIDSKVAERRDEALIKIDEIWAIIDQMKDDFGTPIDRRGALNTTGGRLNAALEKSTVAGALADAVSRPKIYKNYMDMLSVVEKELQETFNIAAVLKERAEEVKRSDEIAPARVNAILLTVLPLQRIANAPRAAKEWSENNKNDSNPAIKASAELVGRLAEAIQNPVDDVDDFLLKVNLEAYKDSVIMLQQKTANAQRIVLNADNRRIEPFVTYVTQFPVQQEGDVLNDEPFELLRDTYTDNLRLFPKNFPTNSNDTLQDMRNIIAIISDPIQARQVAQGEAVPALVKSAVETITDQAQEVKNYYQFEMVLRGIAGAPEKATQHVNARNLAADRKQELRNVITNITNKMADAPGVNADVLNKEGQGDIEAVLAAQKAIDFLVEKTNEMGNANIMRSYLNMYDFFNRLNIAKIIGDNAVIPNARHAAIESERNTLRRAILGEVGATGRPWAQDDPLAAINNRIQPVLALMSAIKPSEQAAALDRKQNSASREAKDFTQRVLARMAQLNNISKPAVEQAQVRRALKSIQDMIDVEAKEVAQIGVQVVGFSDLFDPDQFRTIIDASFLQNVYVQDKSKHAFSLLGDDLDNYLNKKIVDEFFTALRNRQKGDTHLVGAVFLPWVMKDIPKIRHYIKSINAMRTEIVNATFKEGLSEQERALFEAINNTVENGYEDLLKELHKQIERWAEKIKDTANTESDQFEQEVRLATDALKQFYQNISHYYRAVVQIESNTQLEVDKKFLEDMVVKRIQEARGRLGLPSAAGQQARQDIQELEGALTFIKRYRAEERESMTTLTPGETKREEYQALFDDIFHLLEARLDAAESIPDSLKVSLYEVLDARKSEVEKELKKDVTKSDVLKALKDLYQYLAVPTISNIQIAEALGAAEQKVSLLSGMQGEKAKKELQQVLEFTKQFLDKEIKEPGKKLLSRDLDDNYRGYRYIIGDLPGSPDITIAFVQGEIGALKIDLPNKKVELERAVAQAVKDFSSKNVAAVQAKAGALAKELDKIHVLSQRLLQLQVVASDNNIKDNTEAANATPYTPWFWGADVSKLKTDVKKQIQELKKAALDRDATIAQLFALKKQELSDQYTLEINSLLRMKNGLKDVDDLSRSMLEYEKLSGDSRASYTDRFALYSSLLKYLSYEYVKLYNKIAGIEDYIKENDLLYIRQLKHPKKQDIAIDPVPDVNTFLKDKDRESMLVEYGNWSEMYVAKKEEEKAKKLLKERGVKVDKAVREPWLWGAPEIIGEGDKQRNAFPIIYQEAKKILDNLSLHAENSTLAKELLERIQLQVLLFAREYLKALDIVDDNARNNALQNINLQMYAAIKRAKKESEQFFEADYDYPFLALGLALESTEQEKLAEQFGKMVDVLRSGDDQLESAVNGIQNYDAIRNILNKYVQSDLENEYKEIDELKKKLDAMVEKGYGASAVQDSFDRYQKRVADVQNLQREVKSGTEMLHGINAIVDYVDRTKLDESLMQKVHVVKEQLQMLSEIDEEEGVDVQVTLGKIQSALKKEVGFAIDYIAEQARNIESNIGDLKAFITEKDSVTQEDLMRYAQKNVMFEQQVENLLLFIQTLQSALATVEKDDELSNSVQTLQAQKSGIATFMSGWKQFFDAMQAGASRDIEGDVVGASTLKAQVKGLEDRLVQTEEKLKAALEERQKAAAEYDQTIEGLQAKITELEQQKADAPADTQQQIEQLQEQLKAEKAQVAEQYAQEKATLEERIKELQMQIEMQQREYTQEKVELQQARTVAEKQLKEAQEAHQRTTAEYVQTIGSLEAKIATLEQQKAGASTDTQQQIEQLQEQLKAEKAQVAEQYAQEKAALEERIKELQMQTEKLRRSVQTERAQALEAALQQEISFRQKMRRVKQDLARQLKEAVAQEQITADERYRQEVQDKERRILELIQRIEELEKVQKVPDDIVLSPPLKVLSPPSTVLLTPPTSSVPTIKDGGIGMGMPSAMTTFGVVGTLVVLIAAHQWYQYNKSLQLEESGEFA